MISKSLVAIDTGLGGGIAVLDDGIIKLYPMPVDLAELKDIMPYGATVWIEKVPPFIGRLIPSSASFKLGKNSGWVEGFAVGRGHPVMMVMPQVWQKGLGISKDGKPSGKWKAQLKMEAARRYPAVDGLTLKTSDALLILDYAIKHS